MHDVVGVKYHVA